MGARGPTPLIKGPIPPVRGKWPKAKRGRDDGRRPEGIGTSGMEAGAANLPPINETALSSSPHPSGLRPATFPYPLCRFATSPLDKGSRPPGGRLKKSGRRNPPCSKKEKQPGRAEAAGLLIHEAGLDCTGTPGSSSGMSSPEITSSISSSLSTSSWGKRSFTRFRTVVR